jgi:hypothetical protein
MNTVERVEMMVDIQRKIEDMCPELIEIMDRGLCNVKMSVFRIYLIKYSTINGDGAMLTFSKPEVRNPGSLTLLEKCSLLDLPDRLRLYADLLDIIANYKRGI